MTGRAALLALLVAVWAAAPAEANVPPFAANSFERVSWRVGQPLTFDASGSIDPDGSIALYEWDLDGDGVFERSGAALVKPRHTYRATGDYTAQLRVTDNAGASSTIAIAVSIYDVDRVEVLSAPRKLTRRQLLRGFKVEAARNNAGYTRDITVSVACGKRVLAHGVTFVTSQESELARGTLTVKAVGRKEIAATKALRKPARCQLVFVSDGVSVRRPVRVRP
jgi:hypothetical protein